MRKLTGTDGRFLQTNGTGCLHGRDKKGAAERIRRARDNKFRFYYSAGVAVIVAALESYVIRYFLPVEATVKFLPPALRVL